MRASPTGTPGTPTEDTTVGVVPAGYGEGVPRAAGNTAHVWVGDSQRPIRGRVCMDQLVVDLARRAAAGRDRGRPLRPRRPRRAHRPGLGGRRRHDQLRDRDPRRRPAGPQARRHRGRHRRRHRGLRKDHPLSIKGRIFGTVVGAAGLAAAAGAVGIARQNRVIGNRAAGEDVAFGALHSAPRVVVADDARRPARRDRRAGGLRRRARHRRRPDRRLRARLLAQPRLLALPARRLPRPGAHGLLRPAQPRPVGPLRRGALHDRAARPRPAPRHRGHGPRAAASSSATRWAG